MTDRKDNIQTLRILSRERNNMWVLTAVNIHIVFFWVVTQCSLVGGYQSFGSTYCGLFQERRTII
jgi:hypothetical protein